MLARVFAALPDLDECPNVKDGLPCAKWPRLPARPWAR